MRRTPFEKQVDDIKARAEELEAELDKKLFENTEILQTVKQILKEEDREIVNVARLLERLQAVTNYKGV